jgi:hypothetical protein
MSISVSVHVFQIKDQRIIPVKVVIKISIVDDITKLRLTKIGQE